MFRYLLVVTVVGLTAGCGADGISASDGDGVFGIVGLTAAIGGIFGALAHLRNWKAWASVVIFPIAFVGTFVAGPSPSADSDRFFFVLIALTSLGIAAFLIVGFGNAVRNRGCRDRVGDVRGGGFGSGGRYGGGGAAGSW